MTLDDRLDEQFKRMDGTTVLPIYNRPTAIGQAKEAILSDLLELIGEDDIEVRGTTQNPDNPKHWTRKTANRNQLRQELRDKVKEYCE